MMNLILILTIIQADLLNITVPSDYSGWCYIVPADSATSLNDYRANENGVVYVSPDIFMTFYKVGVRQSGLDITSSIKYLSKSEYNRPDGSSYEIVKFYVPGQEIAECCMELNWEDPDVHYKYSKEERKHRNQLIKEGKLVLAN